jgi:hypothetical protein
VVGRAHAADLRTVRRLVDVRRAEILDSELAARQHPPADAPVWSINYRRHGGLVATSQPGDGAKPMRTESFTDVDAGDQAPIQVMNLHQTKGREADAIIAVFRTTDYYGHESEPFERASRLLYVVLTRARQRVTLLLPSSPHELVAPLTELQLRHGA